MALNHKVVTFSAPPFNVLQVAVTFPWTSPLQPAIDTVTGEIIGNFQKLQDFISSLTNGNLDLFSQAGKQTTVFSNLLTFFWVTRKLLLFFAVSACY